MKVKRKPMRALSSDYEMLEGSSGTDMVDYESNHEQNIDTTSNSTQTVVTRTVVTETKRDWFKKHATSTKKEETTKDVSFETIRKITETYPPILSPLEPEKTTKPSTNHAGGSKNDDSYTPDISGETSAPSPAPEILIFSPRDEYPYPKSVEGASMHQSREPPNLDKYEQQLVSRELSRLKGGTRSRPLPERERADNYRPQYKDRERFEADTYRPRYSSPDDDRGYEHAERKPSRHRDRQNSSHSRDSRSYDFRHDDLRSDGSEKPEKYRRYNLRSHPIKDSYPPRLQEKYRSPPRVQEKYRFRKPEVRIFEKLDPINHDEQRILDHCNSLAHEEAVKPFTPEIIEVNRQGMITLSVSGQELHSRGFDQNRRPATARRLRDLSDLITIDSREEAIRTAKEEFYIHLGDPNRLVIWADGSKRARAGSAIAYIRDGVWTAKGYQVPHLRNNNQAEGIAIAMAFHAIISELPNFEHGNGKLIEAVIYTDSKDALHKLGRVYDSDIHRSYAVPDVLESLNKLTGINLELRWVPGHCGVPGNVLADLIAGRSAMY